MGQERLILASESPRRHELLKRILPDFEVVPSLAEELITCEGVEEQGGAPLVEINARLKAREVAARYPGRYVLSADTLVWAFGERFGKPKDESDALNMLLRLSCREHEVHTAVCLITPDGRELIESSRTTVCFAAINLNEALEYIETGEPMDKAGAYALQGIGGKHIRYIYGSPSGVMGLPLFETRELLVKENLVTVKQYE